jgi:hypothetical protein
MCKRTQACGQDLQKTRGTLLAIHSDFAIATASTSQSIEEKAT